jgi:hypothetical protein
MVVRRFRTRYRQAAESHAFDTDKTVSNPAHVLRLTLDDDYLEAVVMVQVNVHG